jgi:parallel beta-helix repeat protein
MDPESGDYSLAPGSPASGYGCQTFLDGRDKAGAASLSARCASAADGTFAQESLRGAPRRDEIEVSGSIDEDTTWNADKVKVVGDVQVENGATLFIPAGVLVEFQDFYKLTVLGAIQAVGEPGRMIRFTTDEPESFQVNHAQTGCWNGIRFPGTLETNAPSRLERCIIEYSKGITGVDYTYAYGGGALSLIDFSKLTVENCIFRHNVGEWGGAIFLYRNASPEIVNNVIVNNHALENASAIYASYSYPRIVNNTMVDNTIHNGANPYIDSCALEHFLAKPLYMNNIIRSNDPEFLYSHSQLWENKDYYTGYNNIEDYELINGNIDADPLFLDPGGGDYHLARTSPCIDAGNTGAPCMTSKDIDGDARNFAGHGGVMSLGASPPALPASVDMGADEYCEVSWSRSVQK